MVARTRFSTWWVLVTSVGTASAVPPSARITSASRSRRSARRAASTTLAPARPNARAAASPIPAEAPVTIATLPVIPQLGSSRIFTIHPFAASRDQVCLFILLIIYILSDKSSFSPGCSSPPRPGQAVQLAVTRTPPSPHKIIYMDIQDRPDKTDRDFDILFILEIHVNTPPTAG